MFSKPRLYLGEERELRNTAFMHCTHTLFTSAGFIQVVAHSLHFVPKDVTITNKAILQSKSKKVNTLHNVDYKFFFPKDTDIRQKTTSLYLWSIKL